jgi:hypothetical protein
MAYGTVAYQCDSLSHITGRKISVLNRPRLLRLVDTEQGEVVLERVDKSPGCGPLRRFADP